MNYKIALCVAAAALSGCTSPDMSANPADGDIFVQAIAATLPKKVDPATTLVEVRSDRHAGIIYIYSVDTSLVKMPSAEDLELVLCDSTPTGNHKFSSSTYVYRDLKGKELANLSIGPACPSQAASRETSQESQKLIESSVALERKALPETLDGVRHDTTEVTGFHEVTMGYTLLNYKAAEVDQNKLITPEKIAVMCAQLKPARKNASYIFNYRGSDDMPITSFRIDAKVCKGIYE